jgi:ACS family D-galactonate transporter-like MFS transporter
MGIVITGLSIGLTLAFLLTPPLISLGVPLFGEEHAWRMPFFVLGAITVVIGFGMHRFFKGQGDFRSAYPNALKGLGGYTVVFLAAVMAVYVISLGRSAGVGGGHSHHRFGPLTLGVHLR